MDHAAQAWPSAAWQGQLEACPPPRLPFRCLWAPGGAEHSPATWRARAGALGLRSGFQPLAGFVFMRVAKHVGWSCQIVLCVRITLNYKLGKNDRFITTRRVFNPLTS